MRWTTVRWLLAVALFLGSLPCSSPEAADPVLDSTFAVNGITRTAFGGVMDSDTPRDLLIQPDGKILTAGISKGYYGDYYVAMTRHSADGVLDSAGFGVDGKVYVHWVLRDQANAIDLMEDGRIVAVGMQQKSNSAGDQICSAYRFLANGMVDSSFADSGCIARRPLLGSFEHGGVKVLPDGSILAGGRSTLNGEVGFYALRYLSDGSGGMWGAYANTPINYNRGACAFPEDGSILMANGAPLSGHYEFVLARVDSAGHVDSTFGGNGVVQTGIETSFNTDLRLLALPGGKMLLVGTTPGAGGNTNWTALRFHPDGTLDSTFGIDGRTDISFGTTGFNNPYDATIDAYGRILIAGRASSPLESALARLLPDGGLDSSFSDDGKFATNLNNYLGSHYFTRVLVLPDGKILTAGYDFNSNRGDFFLARFDLAEPTGIDAAEAFPARLSIHALPNPSFGETAFRFGLSREQAVHVEVFDVAGRAVRRVFDGRLSAGSHLIPWDGRDDAGREASAGVYFTRVSTPEGTQTAKLVRVR